MNSEVDVETISRQQLAQAVGVSSHVIGHWQRQGLLEASGSGPEVGLRSGRGHRYTDADVRLATVLAAARRLGMPLDTDLWLARAAQLRRQLAGSGPVELAAVGPDGVAVGRAAVPAGELLARAGAGALLVALDPSPPVVEEQAREVAHAR